MKKFLIDLLISAVLFAVGFLIGYKGMNAPQETVIETKVDTLYVFDTIRVETPKIVEKRVVDTMTVEVVDYKVVHDTALVNLPREEVVYKDSSYRAVVSGFLPRLEELEIYQKERYITIETTRTIKVEPSRWALSVQGGYGVSAKGLTPYIGLGISYNLYSFPKNRKTTPP